MNRAIIVLSVATLACFYFIVSKRLIIRDIYIHCIHVAVAVAWTQRAK